MAQTHRCTYVSQYSAHRTTGVPLMWQGLVFTIDVFVLSTSSAIVSLVLSVHLRI